MMYISDNFKWDKLVVINYPAGYGGDFFCNLLNMNYDPNHKFAGNSNNKFEWHTVDWYNHFKKTGILFSVYECDDKEKLWETYSKYTSNKIVKHSKKLFAILYDEDPDIFKENYIQYIRNSLYKGYNEGKFIVNTHSSKAGKMLFEVLPGAIMFHLIANKIEHACLFVLLFVIKEKNYEDKKLWIDFLYNNIEMFSIKYTFDNMITIDVGKLFFENGYEEEAENIFSNALNRNITLNRTILSNYKKNNIELLAKNFNIENASELTAIELLELILKPYGNVFNDLYQR